MNDINELHQIITFDGVEYWLNDGDKRNVVVTPGDMGLPPLQFITEDTYNGDGVNLINTFARQRRVGIRIDHQACSRDQYHEIRAQLINIARHNRGGQITYIFYRSDGSKRAIRGLPTTPTFPETSADEYTEQAFQITFDIDCFDPAWFDPDPVILLAQGCPLVAGYNENNLAGSLGIMLGMARLMVSYWGYDTSLIQDDYDSNTLTNNNAVTQVTGKVNLAANFVSASNQSLSRADNASLSPTGDFSLLTWFNPTTLAAAQNPIMKWDGVNDNAFLLEKDASDDVYFHVSNDGTADVSVQASSFGSLTQKWYALHAYHDNGVEIGVGVNGTYDTQAHVTGVFDSAQDFVLGDAVDGMLDETALWTRLLSSAEFQHYYNSGLGRDFSEIVPAVRIAQPFVVTETKQIGTVQGWIQRFGDVLNQSVFARIYDDLGGSPNTSLYTTNQLTDELPGALTGGEAFTHTADGRITFTVTTFDTVASRVKFRIQDGSNSWYCQWDVGGNLALIEQNAGETVRGLVIGAVTLESTIHITFEDETIIFYVDGVAVITYTAAANAKTATGGRVLFFAPDGQINDLRTFVYTGNAAAVADGGASAFPLSFNTPPTLTPGTYWLAIETSLPESVENYIDWASDGAGGYSGGTAKAYRNGAWVDTGLSMIFEIFEYCPDDRQLVFPITFPIYFDGDDVFDSEAIAYEGTWYSFPTITVTGPFDNFRVYHEELDKNIFYLGSLALGQSITLNLAARTLIDSNGVDRWNFLGPLTDIQDFRLQPAPLVSGGVNTLQFYAEGFRDGYTSFQVEYETRYIGI